MIIKKYPHIKQHDEKDCGAACLSMISEYYGLILPLAKYRDLIKVDNMGANMYGLTEGAKVLGFDSDPLEGSVEELIEGVKKGDFSVPFIARIINEYGYEHYIVVWNIEEKHVIIGDPGKINSTSISVEQFISQWQGQIVTFAVTSKFKKENKRKGSLMRYFKYILSQKRMIAFVVLMSIFISSINIIGASAFQYVTQDVQKHTLSVINADNKQENDEYNEEDTSIINIEGRLGSVTEKIFPSMIIMCIAIICMYLLKGIIEIIRDWVLIKTVQRVDIPITMGYYSHLLDLPAIFFDTRKTGDFMTRFNDAGQIRNAISSSVLSLILDTIMAVTSGIFLCWLNLQMFIITLVIIVFYIIYIVIFNKPIKIIDHKLMEQESIVASYLKESIDGIETIKSFNHMQYAKDKTYKLYSKLLDIFVKNGVLISVQDVLTSTTAAIGTVIIITVGGIMCNKNLLSLSELFIFYYMLSYFTEPVKNLVSMQPTIQSAVVAAERLNDINDAETESTFGDPVPNLNGDIVFDHINFRYGNRNLVLNDISLKFKAGTRTALVGESGCGKTTISKLLMMFYEPESGNISISGKNILSYSPIELRKHIAYISQNTFLFADSIYDNLRLGDKTITNEDIEEMCRKCFADEFIRSLPLGYETVIEENGMNLSGGQRQKLAIVRALLRKPDILIMDEATSNLDVISENIIQKVINDYSLDITIIIIAHRLKTIQNCDNIYVIKDGTVVEHGTHDELIDKDGLYAENWKCSC